jgi:hypothetical protein
VTDEKQIIPWQSRLAEATGSLVFVLTLSRRMVAALQFVRDYSPEHCWMQQAKPVFGPAFGHFVPSMRTVENRGLVEHIYYENKEAGNRSAWKLTPAGERVCDLLVFAGLLPAQRITGVELPAPKVTPKKRRAA